MAETILLQLANTLKEFHFLVRDVPVTEILPFVGIKFWCSENIYEALTTTTCRRHALGHGLS